MRRIIKILLAYYKEHYEYLSNNDMTANEALKYLKTNYLMFGICYCSIELLGKGVKSKWIYKTSNKYHNYWFTIPLECSTKAGMLVCLKYRIDKMEEILRDSTPWYYKIINKLFKTDYL